MAQLTPLIAPDAVYWFSNGSHRGRDAILTAIADTFATIRDETYQISDLEWIAATSNHAICRYRFSWTGTINGKPRTGSGRGTNVLVNNDGDLADASRAPQQITRRWHIPTGLDNCSTSTPSEPPCENAT